jgi:hypothetical protein
LVSSEPQSAAERHGHGDSGWPPPDAQHQRCVVVLAVETEILEGKPETESRRTTLSPARAAITSPGRRVTLAADAATVSVPNEARNSAGSWDLLTARAAP